MRITQGTFSFLPDLTDEEIDGADPVRARPRLGDLGSSTPTTRTRATPTGRCGACRCSTSSPSRPEVMREVEAAARRIPSTTSR